MQTTESPATAVGAPVTETCLDCGAPLRRGAFECFDTRFGHTGLYAIAKCSSCTLEQTLPRPDAAQLKALYENFYNFGGEKDTRYTKVREHFLLSPWYRLWLALDGDISFHAVTGSGRLLDVGCNEGRGLKLYQKSGFHAEGLEFNENAAAVARSSGFKVYTDPLSAFFPAMLYDRIVLSNVLEHSLKPSAMLQDLHRLLADGGQLWISCPNSASWLRRLFGRFWINWHVPFHIVHFSSATLTQDVRQAGFDILDVRTETPSLWVTQSILARLYAKPGQPTRELRSVLNVLPILLAVRCLLFPLLWLGNRLGRGDCLVVVARKRLK